MSRQPVDKELLERFRRGEGVAFAQVMRASGELVRYIVSGFFRDPYGQEEAMQEVWIQAYRQREKLDPDRFEQFSGWLSVLARRRCIDLLRRTTRITDREQVRESADIEAVAEPAGQQSAAEARGLAEALAGFQAGLRPQWRAFFELHFGQGLDYGEISSRLAISRLRCKYMKRVLIARARRHRALREALDRIPGEGGGHVR